MKPLTLPWDFVIILGVLGILVPWRGYVRVRRLLSAPEFGATDRLSLYGTTIASQWILSAIVAWRAFYENLGRAALGVTTGDPVRIAWITLLLTGVLCAGQFSSLRRVVLLPLEQRGSLFRITEKIMPRTPVEMLVFVALACTAGLSEEFLYRGFVYAAFARMLENLPWSIVAAAVLSSIWFGIGHLYQGRRGIITTCVVGMVFVISRIASGSLIPSIVAHAGVDLIAGLYLSISSAKVKAHAQA